MKQSNGDNIRVSSFREAAGKINSVVKINCIFVCPYRFACNVECIYDLVYFFAILTGDIFVIAILHLCLVLT